VETFACNAQLRLLDALLAWRVVLAPCPVGYLLATCSVEGVERIFELKGRDRSRPLSVGGTAFHEGRRYLQELGRLQDQAAMSLSATMGLIGTRRDDAPPTPSGVGTPDTLAVFVGLGVVLDPIVDALRLVGDALYLTSANRSGEGNTVRSSALPKGLLAGDVEALLDDSIIPIERRRAARAMASPMVRLGVHPSWARHGAGQDEVMAQLRGAGVDVPACASPV
jgi:tRNA A37 threonylcarbamoyladenosine synthetase subunit TsaC/SUA5/YrdC